MKFPNIVNENFDRLFISSPGMLKTVIIDHEEVALLCGGVQRLHPLTGQCLYLLLMTAAMRTLLDGLAAYQRTC